MQMGEEDLKDAAVLVFANKQDLPNAMSVEEIRTALSMHTMKNSNVSTSSHYVNLLKVWKWKYILRANIVLMLF